jgi:hypothetical protein
MTIECTYCIENVSTVRALLDHLVRLYGLPSLHIILIFDWFNWIIRIQMNKIIFSGTLGDLDAVLQEFGSPQVLDRKLNLTFAHLDSGIDPIQVMQEDHMPIITYGQVDFEELEAFCFQLSYGIGYLLPSLC